MPRRIFEPVLDENYHASKIADSWFKSRQPDSEAFEPPQDASTREKAPLRNATLPQTNMEPEKEPVVFVDYCPVEWGSMLVAGGV